MSGLKEVHKAVRFFSFFPPAKNQGRRDKIFFWLVISVLLLGFLEFAQDYVRSALDNSDFSVSQSLAYKLFWILFIPFTAWFLKVQDTYNGKKAKGRKLLLAGFSILFITALHLFVFSLLLHLISHVISDSPWALSRLIFEKLSTRLYLSLSFYIIIAVVGYFFDSKALTGKVQKDKPTALPIKYGSRTILVEVQNINWIASDGPYIEINTPDKKYLALQSLKAIIETLPENFRRIHKSTIVNIDQVARSESRGNGDYDLVLKCGHTLRLSRNYAKPLKGILH